MKLFSRADLRFRLGWSIALPLLVLMSIFSFWQYLREIQFIQAENENDAETVGDVILMGLKHAMLMNDNAMMETMVQDSRLNEVERVLLLNQNGVVRADSVSNGNENGATLDIKSSGCAECHQYPENALPKILDMHIGGVETLRVATPIANDPECHQCHGSVQKYLGVLLVDVSAQQEQGLARQNALINLGLSILAALLIFFAIYFLLDFLAIRRIRAFMQPLNAYSRGNYDARLPVTKAGDELDRLANTFNGMVAEIETHIEEERRRGELLSQAIVEERERIARELHDSLPQLLAYLNTKIGAIYLFMDRGRKQEALANLRELEDASRNLLTDVRDAIHGLRASRLLTSGLTRAIQNYLEQFKELCRIPVTYSSNLEAGNIRLSPEIEVQAFRIVQEALSNIRKYSNASGASVQTIFRDQQLALIIEDNGVGFDLVSHPASGRSQYGLQTMRERAESLHGEFMIQSQKGKGTTITVTLPLSFENLT
ncbi:MAG TPA: sensor histidine kinase [Anaerolineales bacterium]|nr:sensor histidine kinase [Anaerolineales bacterium]